MVVADRNRLVCDWSPEQRTSPALGAFRRVCVDQAHAAGCGASHAGLIYFTVRRMSGKRPSLQWYPGDWLRDPAVRSVSAAARGLWVDMLCLMFECEPKGYLTLKGRAVSEEQLARMTGCPLHEVHELLRELEGAGVYSLTLDGIIFSRRMVRDEKKRKLCREAGMRGGNPTLKGRVKGGVNPTLAANGKGEPKRNPTPSSSTSSSTSSSELEPKGSNQPPKPPSDFDSFWSAYPRKVAKPAAVKAWQKLAPDAGLVARLLAALERQKRSPQWTKDGGQFVPHPATWLNGRRWEDEVTGDANDGRRYRFDPERDGQLLPPDGAGEGDVPGGPGGGAGAF